MTRQQANQRLIDILNRLVQNNPDLRFHQILQAYDFITTGDLDDTSSPRWINEFYSEPVKVLQRVESALQRRSSNT